MKHKTDQQKVMNFTHADLVRLRRERNSIETRFAATVDLLNAVSMTVNHQAKLVEEKRAEHLACELVLAIKEPKPINFYEIESVEAAGANQTASV